MARQLSRSLLSRILLERKGVSDIKRFAPLGGRQTSYGYRHLTSSSTPLNSGGQTSVASSPQIHSVEAEEGIHRIRTPDILHIEDGELLYSGLTTKELLTALFNLQLVACEPVVDLSIKVLKSTLMKYAVCIVVA